MEQEETYRYIVYIANKDTGYYDSYYSEKESNQICDIIAVFKTKEKAEAYCKDRKDLDFCQVIWEE